MQLDNQRIAIRERGLLDIFDLSLQVLRVAGVPYLLACLAGIVPFVLLNLWLLSGLAEQIELDITAPSEYLWWTLVLTVWEAPLATALATLFLGQVLFVQQVDVRRLLRDFRESLPQLIVFQLILRGLLIPWVITWLLYYVSWPYLNEVILLERNPLTKRKGAGITTWRRSSALHSGAGGDLFGRWLGIVLLGSLLVFIIWFTLWFVRIMLWGDEEFGRTMYTIYLPIALWTVVAYLNVVRFLSYLDLRIRREGWEIELRVRAEAARVTKQIA